VDEQIDDVPWDESFDLAGTTVMTATGPPAYESCRRFHARSIPVVLGGFPPTFNVQEAAEHADATVVGPAGDAWPALLKDAEAGRLQKVYRVNPDVEVPATLPRHLLRKSGYVSVQTCSSRWARVMGMGAYFNQDTDVAGFNSCA